MTSSEKKKFQDRERMRLSRTKQESAIHLLVEENNMMRQALDNDALAWGVMDMDGECLHSVHIDKDHAEKASFGLGFVIPLNIKPLEWLDIRAAPKDGRTVLCFWPELGGDMDVGLSGEPIVGTARYEKPGPGFTEHWCFEGRWTPYDPTHWMPIPSPPKRDGRLLSALAKTVE